MVDHEGARKVSYYDWDPALETGHADIDEQHKAIFRLAGELELTCADCPSLNLVENAVYELSEYVIQHFADEESLMLEKGYPAIEHHMSMHKNMSIETLRMTSEFFRGEDISIEQLAPFVAKWLRTHIQEHDMKFVDFVRAND